MNYKMYELLHTSKRSRDKDIATFKKWEGRVINTDEAIRQFKDNNFIDDRVKIDNVIFEYWLNSLGYRRYDG